MSDSEEFPRCAIVKSSSLAKHGRWDPSFFLRGNMRPHYKGDAEEELLRAKEDVKRAEERIERLEVDIKAAKSRAKTMVDSGEVIPLKQKK